MPPDFRDPRVALAAILATQELLRPHVHRTPLLLGQGLPPVGTGRCRAGGDGPEVTLGQLMDLVGIGVAHHGEHGVGRGVVVLEEAGGVIERGRLQVHEAPVSVVGVVVGAEQHRWEMDPREAPVGPVEHVDPDLLLHDRDLVGQRLLVEAHAQHAVGLQEETQLERSRRQDLEVVGVVLGRAAVELPAVALHQPAVLELLEVH